MSWCSKYTEDKRIGAEGNALNISLTDRRMLIHLPQSGLWKNLLGKKVNEAIRSSNNTFCLILSPCGTGVPEPMKPESLILLGHSDSASLGDPSGMYKSGARTTGQGRMELWISCQTPDHRYLRSRWSEVREAAR